MNIADISQIAQLTTWTLFKIAGPPLLIALIIGVFISFLQAITQIQEQTLSFVPKMMAVALMLILSMYYIGDAMNVLFEYLNGFIIMDNEV